MDRYQVLIVGAGFSGGEAAFRLASQGVRVGLLTQSLDSVWTYAVLKIPDKMGLR
jgi:succinate dehydrogenase/fumarate reductase flavoprotein subunit